jgi:hypothetical protein
MSKSAFYLDDSERNGGPATSSSSRSNLASRTAQESSRGPGYSGAEVDERSSLLSASQDNEHPRRSYTVEMDAADLEGEGRAPSSAMDLLKGDGASVNDSVFVSRGECSSRIK